MSGLNMIIETLRKSQEEFLKRREENQRKAQAKGLSIERIETKSMSEVARILEVRAEKGEKGAVLMVDGDGEELALSAPWVWLPEDERKLHRKTIARLPSMLADAGISLSEQFSSDREFVPYFEKRSSSESLLALGNPSIFSAAILGKRERREPESPMEEFARRWAESEPNKAKQDALLACDGWRVLARVLPSTGAATKAAEKRALADLLYRERILKATNAVDKDLFEIVSKASVVAGSKRAVLPQEEATLQRSRRRMLLIACELGDEKALNWILSEKIPGGLNFANGKGETPMSKLAESKAGDAVRIRIGDSLLANGLDLTEEGVISQEKTRDPFYVAAKRTRNDERERFAKWMGIKAAECAVKSMGFEEASRALSEAERKARDEPRLFGSTWLGAAKAQMELMEIEAAADGEETTSKKDRFRKL